MAKARKIPLRKSVVSGEIIDKRDLLRIVKIKKVKYLSIQQARQMVVELTSSLTMMRQTKLRNVVSSIVPLVWKWPKNFTMN